MARNKFRDLEFECAYFDLDKVIWPLIYMKGVVIIWIQAAIRVLYSLIYNPGSVNFYVFDLRFNNVWDLTLCKAVL